MSHEMYENDSAVYAGQAAWHGLGTVVEESLSPREALAVSGLDWNVEKSAYISAPVRGGLAVCKDRVATIREDTNEILGIVSPNYQIVQNKELFDIAYELGGEVKVDTAGSLKNGRQVYVLLKGDTFDATKKGDEVTEYLALLNSFDGSLGLGALPTSIRIVCANTLSMALSSGRGNMFRVRHYGDNMMEKLDALREALVRYRETGTLFRETVTQLSSVSWDRQKIQNFWLDVYQTMEGPVTSNPTTEQEEEDYKKAAVTMGSWAGTFDDELYVAGASPWNAANAVTNWIQHKTPSRGRKRTAASKVQNNLIGEAQKDSIKVMKMALASV